MIQENVIVYEVGGGGGGSPGFSGCSISAMALGLKRERFTSGEQKTQEF